MEAARVRPALAAAWGLLALLAVLAPLPAAVAQEGAMLHIASNSFIPADLNVTGGEVIVMNFDPVAHTVTADDGTFDLGLPAAPPNNFTEVRFPPPPVGTHAYHCRIHPQMRGTLTVLGAPATPPPTTTDDVPSGFAALALTAMGVAAGAAPRLRRP